MLTHLNILFKCKYLVIRFCVAPNKQNLFLSKLNLRKNYWISLIGILNILVLRKVFGVLTIHPLSPQVLTRFNF